MKKARLAFITLLGIVCLLDAGLGQPILVPSLPGWRIPESSDIISPRDNGFSVRHRFLRLPSKGHTVTEVSFYRHTIIGITYHLTDVTFQEELEGAYFVPGTPMCILFGNGLCSIYDALTGENTIEELCESEYYICESKQGLRFRIDFSSGAVRIGCLGRDLR